MEFSFPQPDTSRSWERLATRGIHQATAELGILDDPELEEFLRGPETPPTRWQDWLRGLFPAYVSSFAAYHEEFWDWLWSIEADNRPRPFVGIWARGAGKSTSAELGATALGVRGRRRYALYVRATQDNADKSVANIAGLLESGSIARYYPAHADRAIGKYGSSKGWRRERLRTAGGLTIDAIGLDTAARGAKVEAQRPDLIIIDDVDGEHDSALITRKKRETLTKTILPAAAPNAAVVAIQNLIIPHGIFAQLADDRADFLVDRVLSGPHPAVRGLKTEIRYDQDLGKNRAVIVAGMPTWEGQNLARCQNIIDTEGLTAFLQERQHEVHEREGALWKKAWIGRRDAAPHLVRVVVGVDPSGGRAEIGIVAAGIGSDGRGYVLNDWTQPGRLGPLNWGAKTIELYDELEADRIVAEKNFGGDMVESNIRVAAGSDGHHGNGNGNGNGNGKRKPPRRIPVKLVSASRGKAVRAEPVAALYQDGLVDHVGTFPELERELTQWTPLDSESPNRLDALVWALTELMVKPKPRARPRILSTSHATV